MRRLLLVLPCLAAVLLILGAVMAVSMPRPAPATPTHVAAVFFDGVNHADFRETCAAWQAGRKAAAQCEAYLILRAATVGPGIYRVVPHSVKQWREGRVSVASVRVRGLYGSVLTVRLVKTRKHGWLVVSAA